MKKNLIYGCITAFVICLITLAGFAKNKAVTVNISELVSDNYNCCIPHPGSECETPTSVYSDYRLGWCD
jgi:hypothetical protein